jgi:hypothetical protein
MSQYLMLIYNCQSPFTEQEQVEMHDAHGRFGKEHADVLAGGNALFPPTTATSVREDGAGGFSVTDGPFTETKEALGGYYLAEAPDLDAAIALAKRIPMTAGGGIEVRPVRPVTFD